MIARKPALNLVDEINNFLGGRCQYDDLIREPTPMSQDNAALPWSGCVKLGHFLFTPRIRGP